MEFQALAAPFLPPFFVVTSYYGDEKEDNEKEVGLSCPSLLLMKPITRLEFQQ
jgi:hypothetical protein